MLVICLGIFIPGILTAPGLGAKGAALAKAVPFAMIVMAVGVWASTRDAGMYLGSTTLRDDGLLILTPRRPQLLLTWQEIEDLKVDVYSSGKSRSRILGVRVKPRNAKAIFLPGLLKGDRQPDPVFDERARLIESAWASNRPGDPAS